MLFAGQSRLLPRTTSPDPDLSQSVSSDSQQHTVVADQRGGARSGIELHFIQKDREGEREREERKGGRIPPFLELQQLHRPLLCRFLLLAVAAGEEEEEEEPGTCGTKTGTVPANSPLGAVSALRTEERKATFPRRNSAGNFPAQHRSRTSRPLYL